MTKDETPKSPYGFVMTAFAGFFLIASSAMSRPPPPAVDPIFGLTYDSTAVTFESAPAALSSTCKELTNEGWGRTMWVFAQAGTPDDHYIIIGGYFLKRGVNGPMNLAMEADTSGALIHLKGDHCELIAAPRDAFDFPEGTMESSKLKALANDAVKRYANAFGGTKPFLEALHLQRINLKSSSILNDAVLEARAESVNR